MRVTNESTNASNHPRTFDGTSAPPAPDFGHILHMTDSRGTFERAEQAEPQPEHGYCTDDMARLLVVTTRDPEPVAAVSRLAGISLRFLNEAQSLGGAYRNRMNRKGQWDDAPATEDCWGRSIWGLGTAIARSDAEWVRQTAAVQFERAAKQRSPHPRTMAFAALGAAELLAVTPEHKAARALMTDAADAMTPPTDDASWRWPEVRLAYANAVVPEAMIAAGTALDRPSLVQQGLQLLEWLLEHETVEGHLSVTPAAGAGAGDARPGFEQRPIEVAALADACARAALVDDNPRWRAGIVLAVAWFLGDNDGDALMWDPLTGGGFDSLQADGANIDQGTEATLALLSTLQHAQHLVPVPS